MRLLLSGRKTFFYPPLPGVYYLNCLCSKGLWVKTENKMANTAKEEPQKKTRLDWRKEKELEEARKAGTAPALQDEEGR